tara:strand:- start:6757 stop:7056 length:300 start_codon:yes stop_codon:yes gene_type:complete
MSSIKLNTLAFNNTVLEVGKFIYSNHYKANVEVLSLCCTGNGIHDNRIHVAGINGSTNSLTFMNFQSDKPTVFHVADGCCYHEVAREVITDLDFIKSQL